MSVASLDNQADRIIQELEPEGGWWTTSVEDTLARTAFDMLQSGNDYDIVKEWLGDVISAIRSEYGE